MNVSTHELANRSTSTERAAQLETHAAEFPEQRGMLLIEAALAWRRAGQSQRATQLIDEVIATGGEDGCYARVQRVEFCLDDDAWPQAEAQLAILAHEPSLHEGHCTLIAELLIEHHRLQAAARWYDRGLARLTPQTLRAITGPRGFTQLSALAMLRGRRDLRSRLGQPPDATDELVADPSQWRSPTVNPPDLDAVAEHLAAGGPPPRGVRILTFQRDQRAQARTRWPQTYPDPDEQYYPAAEARWRNLADNGARDIQIVPVTVAELVDFAQRTGADPTDAAVKTQYIQTVSPQAMIPWPPPRNAPCWCGSGAKYKKCCGQPR
jgi:hypothetical protein